MIKKFFKLFGIFLVFILLAKFIYSQGWYQVTKTNSQSTATPAPFQQDIAICNGTLNVGSSFAYINNATYLMKLIVMDQMFILQQIHPTQIYIHGMKDN